MTVTEFAAGPMPDLGFLCRLIGGARVTGAAAAGFVQRIGVSPDGSLVVFETTNAFSILPLGPLPPEQEGVFVVRADGSGLRRLGPASRESCHLIVPDLASPIRFQAWASCNLSFSPDGRSITYTDRPDGEEAPQIFALDAMTGARTQLTSLPFAPKPKELRPVTFGPFFVDDETIRFISYTNPDGSNPDGGPAAFEVDRRGSEPRRGAFPVAQDGSRLVPEFQITAGQSGVLTIRLPGTPENEVLGDGIMREAFLTDGDNLLQLTTFRRVDTFSDGIVGTAGRQRVLIRASTDQLGTNPTENCQFFSISTTGTDLRQLTSFSDGARSVNGCSSSTGNVRPGCGLYFNAVDARTGAVVFASNCDPLGSNPNGAQMFSMQPDGTGLRQLTNFRGYVIEPEGSATYEFPVASAYGPYR